jgi:uncharacterized protein
MSRPVALITGPTSGIGAGYARRYAADGHDLVLVARDVDRLTQLADDLQSETSSIEILAADLADPEGRGKVAERLAGGVRIAVNNALRVIPTSWTRRWSACPIQHCSLGDRGR